ncbi:Acetolactate synthase large subunit [Pseudomonas flavescens]|uniref:Acetolactate synthase large subunit n=1 Tax=Phytopseudomonas flavescens TaxID=29435 RepID=A0A1G8EFU8_9GAMM|nr:decarboxylase [Pseudomonas flavescens]SDH68569.1 Acetolactate synthase large subunit [Pseudomonas flavescens]
MKATLGICLITQAQPLIEDVAFVIEQVQAGLHPPATSVERSLEDIDCEAMHRALGPSPHSAAVLETLALQARRYLRGSPASMAAVPDLRLLTFDSLQAAREHLSCQHPPLSNELFILDLGQRGEAGTEDPFEELIAAAPESRLSPHSALLYCALTALPGWIDRIGGNRHLRVAGEDRAARRADLLRIVIDHLEHAHFNRLLARSIGGPLPSVSLATEVTRFMRSRWQERWDFHYYTGSMVAGLIQSMQENVAGSGIRCLGGCNEHSLAVSAMAGWQLFGRAYVIAVTSGMIDEFRGTLANLRRVGAPGLIICADSPDSVWYAFQGTQDADNDGRRVIEARGLRQVFIRKVEEVGARLEEAFALLAERAGPVFILATQGVLESRPPVPLDVRLPALAAPLAWRPDTRQRAALDQALALINRQPLHLLWQCGTLSDEQRRRVHALAERGAIGLADSITQPGSVGPYHQGRPVAHYLGPLSLYGFSRRVYRFVHTEHELNSPQEHCVFFLKSKVDQAATPFSEGKLKRQLRVVQVNHEPRHLSPFTDLALDVPLDAFLDHVERGLQVEPQVLELRRAKLQAMARCSETVAADHIETLPMTANYFFQRLGRLVRELIEQQGYRYTGVYDVGRCGVSAVRNVPRTDPGFSGWYGRALMGDGLMALPYIAITGERNVLAFVGDGARALVPDIETRLAQGLAREPQAEGRNVSLFYLTNGMLSLIQTYLDKRYAHNGAQQVGIANAAPLAPLMQHVGAIRVHRERLIRFDETALRSALTRPGQLNIFDVLLAHNSEGDGLSLVSETAWNRQ